MPRGEGSELGQEKRGASGGNAYLVFDRERRDYFIAEINYDLDFAKQSLSNIEISRQIDSFPGSDFINTLNAIELSLKNLTPEDRNQIGEDFLKVVENNLPQLWQNFSEKIQFINNTRDQVESVGSC